MSSTDAATSASRYSLVERAAVLRSADYSRLLTRRVVVVGFTGGSIPEVRVNRLLLKNTEVVGAGWGAYVMSKPEVCREIGAALDEMIERGVVRPIVGARFPLEEAGDALKLIDGRGATGKVVLDVKS